MCAEPFPRKESKGVQNELNFTGETVLTLWAFGHKVWTLWNPEMKPQKRSHVVAEACAQEQAEEA